MFVIYVRLRPEIVFGEAANAQWIQGLNQKALTGMFFKRRYHFIDLVMKSSSTMLILNLNLFPTKFTKFSELVSSKSSPI